MEAVIHLLNWVLSSGKKPMKHNKEKGLLFEDHEPDFQNLRGSELHIYTWLSVFVLKKSWWSCIFSSYLPRVSIQHNFLMHRKHLFNETTLSASGMLQSGGFRSKNKIYNNVEQMFGFLLCFLGFFVFCFVGVFFAVIS